VAFALAACGADPAPISAAALPARLEGMSATSLTELDTQALAAQAIDRGELSTLLGSAHFEAAIERSYLPTGPALRRVEVLLARFDSGPDAERYLQWQLDHVADVIGEAQPADVDPGAEMSIFVHLPGGCCPKEQVIALSAWRNGADVVRVLVAGPDADGPEAASLIGRLHATLPGDA
jgi:hypothetical protein